MAPRLSGQSLPAHSYAEIEFRMVDQTTFPGLHAAAVPTACSRNRSRSATYGKTASSAVTTGQFSWLTAATILSAVLTGAASTRSTPC